MIGSVSIDKTYKVSIYKKINTSKDYKGCDNIPKIRPTETSNVIKMAKRA
jgi:hypothetical protein